MFLKFNEIIFNKMICRKFLSYILNIIVRMLELFLYKLKSVLNVIKGMCFLEIFVSKRCNIVFF